MDKEKIVSLLDELEKCVRDFFKTHNVNNVFRSLNIISQIRSSLKPRDTDISWNDVYLTCSRPTIAQ